MKSKGKPFTNINFLTDLIRNIQSGNILTRYSHDNIITSVDGRACLNFDCSGFASYYYTQIGASGALDEIVKFIIHTKNIPADKIRKIYASEFQMFADNIVRNNKSKYWTEIQHPIELRHGDLITYTTTGPRQNHCMLVNHLIRTEKDRATVQVIDSTQHPHINDTRRHDQTGIGMGEIILYKINNQWREYRHNIYTYQGTITMMRIK